MGTYLIELSQDIDRTKAAIARQIPRTRYISMKRQAQEKQRKSMEMNETVMKSSSNNPLRQSYVSGSTQLKDDEKTSTQS